MRNWGYFIILLLLAFEKCWQWFFSSNGIIASYADDLLVIPLLMGAALWLQQKFVSEKFVFSKLQIISYWVLFSLVFEIAFPALIAKYTADPIDIIAYAGGSIYFYFFINHPAVKTKS